MKKIALIQGQITLVDDSDFDWLSCWKWFAHKRCGIFYAARTDRSIPGEQHTISMHRQILGIQDPLILVDHWDMCGLHNWRGNLRITNKSGNGGNRGKNKNNTSGFKGVSRDSETGKWIATIRVMENRIKLGRFSVPEEAARVYDSAARKYFGEFARTNFPA